MKDFCDLYFTSLELRHDDDLSYESRREARFISIISHDLWNDSHKENADEKTLYDDMIELNKRLDLLEGEINGR